MLLCSLPHSCIDADFSLIVRIVEIKLKFSCLCSKQLCDRTVLQSPSVHAFDWKLIMTKIIEFPWELIEEL